MFAISLQEECLSVEVQRKHQLFLQFYSQFDKPMPKFDYKGRIYIEILGILEDRLRLQYPSMPRANIEEVMQNQLGIAENDPDVNQNYLAILRFLYDDGKIRAQLARFIEENCRDAPVLNNPLSRFRYYKNSPFKLTDTCSRGCVKIFRGPENIHFAQVSGRLIKIPCAKAANAFYLYCKKRALALIESQEFTAFNGSIYYRADSTTWRILGRTQNGAREIKADAISEGALIRVNRDIRTVEIVTPMRSVKSPWPIIDGRMIVNCLNVSVGYHGIYFIFLTTLRTCHCDGIIPGCVCLATFSARVDCFMDAQATNRVSFPHFLGESFLGPQWHLEVHVELEQIQFALDTSRTVTVSNQSHLVLQHGQSPALSLYLKDQMDDPVRLINECILKIGSWGPMLRQPSD